MSLVAGLLAVHSSSINELLTFFARGGGGGSGGGGGGGGSGGGGDALAIIGYLPMHFLGSILRSFKTKHQQLDKIVQITGWIIAVIYALLLARFLGFIGIIIGCLALSGMGAGLYGWLGKLKQSKATKKALDDASKTDGAWSEDKIIEHTKTIFVKYQQDWTGFNTESMKSYMTPAYQYHAALMMYALQLAKRQNVMEEVTIFTVEIVDLSDNTDNSLDTVLVGIEASAKDILIDTQDNKVLFTDNSTFTEFWRLKRSGDTWLLDGIQQATASAWVHNAGLEDFATKQGYYYSLDWGWLLLPRRGQLFKKGQFGVADINNHLIGMHGQCLVQMYTYSAYGYSDSSNFNFSLSTKNDTYLVAQTNLPKSYGDIVVKKKSLGNIFTSMGPLRKISTEWLDFNKKYDVYATNAEQATSLELLNPKFMEKIEAIPFEVNIEVVDNVVYLYANQRKTASSAEDYQLMLDILNDAFKEMKL